MKITKKEVEYVARLARLALSEEEKEKFTGQLETILEYIGKLNELDTRDVPPTHHILASNNVWREDVPAPSSDELRQRIMKNAPESEKDFFKVKKVIE
jgi:aspartyl-tRNA(Asn)/glutamyl-tRNA(Gln) amidotransferase subunit C